MIVGVSTCMWVTDARGTLFNLDRYDEVIACRRSDGTYAVVAVGKGKTPRLIGVCSTEPEALYVINGVIGKALNDGRRHLRIVGWPVTGREGVSEGGMQDAIASVGT